MKVLDDTDLQRLPEGYKQSTLLRDFIFPDDDNLLVQTSRIRISGRYSMVKRYECFIKAAHWR